MGRRVLIVEDEPLVLATTAMMVEDLGCEVVMARTGREALARLVENEQIDVLMTDINLPGMNGYEVAARAQQIRDGLHVILVSGIRDDDHGYPLIQKPVLADDLMRTMERTAGPC
jgi:two-component system, cell cycle response regulator CpdR